MEKKNERKKKRKVVLQVTREELVSTGCDAGTTKLLRSDLFFFSRRISPPDWFATQESDEQRQDIG